MVASMSFDLYDTVNKDYKIIFSNGKEDTFTKQDLWEWFLLSEHGILIDFDTMLNRLDKELEFTASHYEYDWSLSTNIYKGKLIIKKINQEVKVSTPTKSETFNTCKHNNKYINEAGGIKFWFCKDCKEDLGDV